MGKEKPTSAKLFRIVLPLSVCEYMKGQPYTTSCMYRRTAESGTAKFDILSFRETQSAEHGVVRKHTHKLMDMTRSVPKNVRIFLRRDWMTVCETSETRAHTQSPGAVLETKTSYSIPSVAETKFSAWIHTVIASADDCTPVVRGIDRSSLRKIQLCEIAPAGDTWRAARAKSAALDTWRCAHTGGGDAVYAYKLVFVRANLVPLFNDLIANTISDSLSAVFGDFFGELFRMRDTWSAMPDAEISAFEHETLEHMVRVGRRQCP